MIDNLLIRRLNKNDVTDFFNLRLKSLQEYPSSYLSSHDEEKKAGSSFYENLLTSDDPKNVIFGAFIKNKMIGMIGIYQEKATKAAHKCNIWGMYVQADYRKHSVGKKLLETAIKHGNEKMHCLIVNLSVETNNIAAKNLYEAYSFKAWGKKAKAICVDQRFYDLFHMSLLL
jgi:ribosomal protein S18 acetylase RimI-like enzyme